MERNKVDYDLKLLKEAQGGSCDSLNELLNDLRIMILGITKRILSGEIWHQGDVDEFTQEVMIEVSKRIMDIRSNPKSYARRILWRKIKKERMTRTKRQRESLRVDTPITCMINGDATHVVDEDKMPYLIHNAIRKMGDFCQKYFNLLLNGLSNKKSHKILQELFPDFERGALYQRESRCRSQFKNLLKEEIRIYFKNVG